MPLTKVASRSHRAASTPASSAAPPTYSNKSSALSLNVLGETILAATSTPRRTSLPDRLTPVRPTCSSPTNSSEAEEASTCDERLAIDLQDKHVESMALKEYFTANPTTAEKGSIKSILAHLPIRGVIGKEIDMATIVREVNLRMNDGPLRLVVSAGSQLPVQNEEDQFNENKTPDVVVLSRKAASDPTYAQAWKKSQAGDRDVRRWEQVIVAGELKIDDSISVRSRARQQTLGHLLHLLVTPIRLHAFGFSVTSNILIIYLTTPSASFHSGSIDCTNDAGTFILFLLRLLCLTDLQLGLLGSYATPPLSPSNSITLHLSTSDLLRTTLNLFTPASLQDLPGVDFSTLKLDTLLFRGFTATGRATSTFAGTVGQTKARVAVSIVFPEAGRMKELDDVRVAISSAPLAERSHLSLTLGVLRSDFQLGPAFLQLESHNLTPRAIEIVVHDRIYSPLLSVNSTKDLARAALGGVKGHQQLYLLGYLHHDISDGNLMVDSGGEGILIDYNLAVGIDGTVEEKVERGHRSGTFPFLARSLLDKRSRELRKPHLIPHDFESLFYAVLYATFVKCPQSSSLEPMSLDAASFWSLWNSSTGSGALNSKLGFRTGAGKRAFVEAAQPGWIRLRELVDILCGSCGFMDDMNKIETTAEEDTYLLEHPELVTHERLIRELETFIESL